MTNSADGTVARIDPSQLDAHVNPRVVIGGPPPVEGDINPVAISDSGVWVTAFGQDGLGGAPGGDWRGSLRKIDGETGDVQHPPILAMDATWFGPTAANDDAVWITAMRFGDEAPHNIVLRVNGNTGEVQAEIPIEAGDVAVGPDAVWILEFGAERKDTLTRIDPLSGEVRARLELPRGATTSDADTALQVGGGAVWVALGNGVVRVNAATNEVSWMREFEGGASYVAATDSAVWVAHSLDGAISQLDPDTGAVVARIELEASFDRVVNPIVRDVEVSASGVWVIFEASG